MTSIVFDFADIRSRMLGEDKPDPKAIVAKPLPATQAAIPVYGGISDPTHCHPNVASSIAAGAQSAPILPLLPDYTPAKCYYRYTSAARHAQCEGFEANPNDKSDWKE